MPVRPRSFPDLPALAQHLRDELQTKKFVLLYAYNGTGKTRLSTEFKDLGKKRRRSRDTLYFNAFTEDLFQWDNDLENDRERVLKINKDRASSPGSASWRWTTASARCSTATPISNSAIDTDRVGGRVSRARCENGDEAGDGGGHQGLARRGEHLHLVLLPRHRAARARRGRGVQVGQVHLHR